MITVVFASFNGEGTLPIMLEAFCKLLIPDSGWEIIAVDNASTDQTANIIKSYQTKLPIRYLYEPIAGKNNALNLALSVIRGQLIVFTDDDVVPDRNWLFSINTCAESHPDFAIFGGAIKPLWPRQPEEWILQHVPLGITYALTNENLPEGAISTSSVWGPNMAIRRSVFDSGYRYNGNIGPDGSNNYVMGSESEFTKRLDQAGYKAWFCRNAIVQHIVREHQLNPDWIAKRAFRYGRSMFIQTATANVPCGFLMLGMPPWMIRKLLEQYWFLAIAIMAGNSAAKNIARWEINLIHGYQFQYSQNKQT